jgi:exopolyphosphatase/pppGpp-phosphohydrolase
MQDQNRPICAAIDIGSNTIHLVVARCSPKYLDILENQQELVRIGESVTATGAISPQKREDTISVLRKYQALAEQHAAHPLLAVATEAIRQANNSEEFLADILRETGLNVHIIEGNVEATLTFYGATSALIDDSHPTAQIGVMDLGGGSTELVVAKNMQITHRTSLPIGSGWLRHHYFHADPPTSDDIAAASTFLHDYFENVHSEYCAPQLIVTGGSANALLYLAQQILSIPQDQLTYADLVSCKNLLSTLPAKDIAQRYKIAIQRAHILLAGNLIILTVMEHCQLDKITVSPHGIREGILLAYARYGEQWLQQISQHTTIAQE